MIKKVVLSIISTFLLLCILIGVSYSFYVANVKYMNHTDTVILSKILNLEVVDTNEINIKDMVPGQSVEKTFTVENKSNKQTTFNILFKQITNGFDDDLVYELYEGNKLVVSESVAPQSSDISYIKTNIAIDAAEIKNYTLKITFLYKEDVQDNQGETFNALLEIDSSQMIEEIKTATNYLLRVNNVETKSYMYTGNAQNNYVLLGDELWRIIRIEDDGSIRMIKNTSINDNSLYAFNTENFKNSTDGYRTSSIKNILEEYYNQNLKQYENLLTDGNYCEELHVVPGEQYKLNDNDKIYNEYEPSLSCSSTYRSKIGLISYDEAVLIGLSYKKSNSNNYLTDSTNSGTWTNSLAGQHQTNENYYVWKISPNGSIIEEVVTEQNTAIRPVITLKGSINVTGKGTNEEPYTFSQ